MRQKDIHISLLFFHRVNSVLPLLDRTESIAYDELVWGLSSFLYEQEVKIGGWALDIGVFGASLFVPEARRELELAKGILWEIDSPRKDSNELLSNLSRDERPTLLGDWRRGRRGAESRRATGRRSRRDS